MKRMFTRSVYQARRIWWQDVISTTVEWTLTALICFYISYCVVDAMFPNIPL